MRDNNKLPIIILVRPQMGENIGAVARAMANFGLSSLRLVEPRDGWPNKRAKATASGAVHILRDAKLFPDLPSALSDVTRIYAATARSREMAKRELAPDSAIAEINNNSENPAEISAIMFGAERAGLSNEDVSWCDAIVTIPTAPVYTSLNLAQSVVIMAYEWHKSQMQRALNNKNNNLGNLNSSDKSISVAPIAQYDYLFRQLENYLDTANFFKVAEKKPGMWLNIKTMLLRSKFTEQEIRTMHGIFRALAKE